MKLVTNGSEIPKDGMEHYVTIESTTTYVPDTYGQGNGSPEYHPQIRLFESKEELADWIGTRGRHDAFTVLAVRRVGYETKVVVDIN